MPAPLGRDPLGFAKITSGVDVQATRAMQFVAPSGPGVYCGPGMAPAQAPSGQSAVDAMLSRMVFPPYLYKLSASRDFNLNDYRIALPAGVGATITPPSLAFQAPKTSVGFVQNFSQYTLTPTAATYASWTLLINGAPVPGYDDVRNPPGIANLVEVFESNIQIRIPMGAKVSVRITNLDGSAATIGGLIRGWFHPLAAESRAWGLDL